MRRYKSIFLGLAVMLFTTTSIFAQVTVQEVKGKGGVILKVENPYYQATILPDKGGRIGSLISKKSGYNFTNDEEKQQGYGIGKDIDAKEGFPGFTEKVYQYKIIEKSTNKITIQLSCLVEEEESYSKGIKIEKRYTFFSTTPSIKVDVRIKNQGKAQRFTYRTHNSVCAGGEVDNNDIWFAPSTKGMTEVKHKPGHYYINDFISGWAGVMDKESKGAIFIKVDYNRLDEFYFYIANNASNIEPFYKPVALETGDIWQTIYYVIPIDNLLSIPSYVDEERIVYAKIENSLLSLKLQEIGREEEEMTIKGEILDKDNSVITNLEPRKVTLEKDTLAKLSFPLSSEGSGIKISLQKERGSAINSFIVPIKNTFIAKRPEPIPAVIQKGKEVAASSLSQKQDKEIRILLVGAKQTHFVYSQYELYRIEESLAKAPFKYKIDFCRCINTMKKDYFVKNFPISVRGFQKYDILIFVDIPAWAFYPKDEENLKKYVEKGGNIIFIGDQGRGYKGTILSNIIPVEIDYSKTLHLSFGAKREIILDKSRAGKINIVTPEHPVFMGLGKEYLPKIVVHKTKAKKGANILAAMDNYPLLIIKNQGKGHVISFPITFTEDNWNPRAHSSPDARARNWDDKLVCWDYYDEFWQQMILWLAEKNLPVNFVKLQAPASLENIKIPSQSIISYNIKNNSRHLCKGGIYFSLFKNGQPIKKERKDYSLSPEEKANFSHNLTLSGGQGRYDYKIEIKDRKNNFISYRDGSFKAFPQTYLKLAIEGERTNVFGRNTDINLSIELSGKVATNNLQIKTDLVDFQNEVVSSLPVESMGEIKKITQTLALDNLSKGDYKVKVDLLDNAEIIDRIEKPIYIVSPIQDNFFPIIMMDGLASTPIKMKEKIKEMVALNINGWPAYGSGFSNIWRQTMDIAQREGMVLVPRNSHLSCLTGLNRRGCKVSCYDAMDERIRENLAKYHQYFGKSPRLFAFYVGDEIGVIGVTPTEKKIFKEKYGYEIPMDPKDKNFYYAKKFLTESMVKGLKKQNKAMEEFGWKVKQWVIESPCHNLCHTVRNHGYVDIEGMASNLDFIAVDCYILNTREACTYLDVLWGASKSRDNIWLTGSAARTSPFYPEYMGHQTYQALGHGVKGLSFFLWAGLTRESFTAFPERLLCAKKAFGEAKRIGPLFMKLNKQRAKIALLHAGTSVSLSGKRGYWEIVHSHIPLCSAFGHTDILQESQIEKGEVLKDYNVLFLDDASYLPDKVSEEIMSWLRKGNTLIATARTGLYNQEQQKSNLPSTLFSAQYGKEVALPVKGIFSLPIRGYELLSDKAKVLYTYNNGKPAVTQINYGRGKAILLGFGLKNAPKEFLLTLTKGIDTLVCRSDNPDACAHSFTDKRGIAHYVVAVNHKNPPQECQINVSVNLPQKQYYIYDILTGERLSYSYKDNLLQIPVQLEPLWGKAIAILTQEPERLSLEIKSSFPRGENLIYQVTLSGKQKSLSGSLPIEIKITDSLGRTREEYGGIRVLANGEYKGNFRLANNEPEGGWRIEVRERISGKEIGKAFIVK